MNWFDLRKKLSFKGDRILWYVIIGLMLASVMVVYSSTGSLAYRVRSGNTSYFLICKDCSGDVVHFFVMG